MIGRILALPIVAVTTVGARLGELRFLVYLIIPVQILLWLGYLAPAGEAFIYMVYVASGALAIAAMIELPIMCWRKKAKGLRDEFMGEEQPAQKIPQPEVRRHDDTLAKQIEYTLSDWAENLSSKIDKIENAIYELLPWRR